MGVYFTNHLFYGSVGSLKDGQSMDLDIDGLDEKIDEFCKENNLVFEVFNPTFKSIDIDRSELDVIIGYEIGKENDVFQEFDIEVIEDRIIEAKHKVTNKLSKELNEKFPEFEWSDIILKGIVTDG